ncbi:unnamed protein product [Bursaphelenchus okinawaensis]|uniref:Uncharacterized protein n=1 Tax=Bursaphelenchus okinawaensis TaxID=465554 RepID=A0A811LJS8_9BILA|nr:unnamed protein product [Bursaphelenchus okinawaensis]CAG9124956.1 unnamed protein product [Bursaphelenchus okinawaensis]
MAPPKKSRKLKENKNQAILDEVKKELEEHVEAWNEKEKKLVERTKMIIFENIQDVVKVMFQNRNDGHLTVQEFLEKAENPMERIMELENDDPDLDNIDVIPASQSDDVSVGDTTMMVIESLMEKAAKRGPGYNQKLQKVMEEMRNKK